MWLRWTLETSRDGTNKSLPVRVIQPVHGASNCKDSLLLLWFVYLIDLRNGQPLAFFEHNFTQYLLEHAFMDINLRMFKLFEHE